MVLLDSVISLGSFVAIVFIIQRPDIWMRVTGHLSPMVEIVLRIAAATTAGGYFWKFVDPPQPTWQVLIVDISICVALWVAYSQLNRKCIAAHHKKIYY